MIVVSNTSPLTNLAAIGLFDVLHELYGTIHIAEAVWDELHAGNQIWPGTKEVEDADWIQRHTVHNESFVQALSLSLDKGEAETIALSVELGATLSIIDEQEGRKWATRFNVNVVGVLGVLIQAKSNLLITHVGPYLDKLRYEARFFIHPILYEAVLRKTNEL